jgi:hypothetical protein
MSQVTQITIDNVAFGTFRSNLNDTLNALNSMHSGTSRPASATTGTIWLDTTNAGSNSLTIKFFDGTDDITVADVDTSANTINFIDSTVTTELISDLSPQLGGMLDVNGNAIGNGTEELIKFSETASAVNEITVTNSATGNAPEISATGDDTDIDLKLTPKGSGNLNLDGLIFPNADGTTGQFLKTDGSGNLSFDTAGGGITSAEHWRLTTSFTGDADPIASNLERADNTKSGNIGTNITQSSGVFTLPTGIWKIEFVPEIYGAGGDDYQVNLEIDVDETNSGSFTNYATGLINLVNTAWTTGYVSTMVDVTSSDVKVRFAIVGMGGGGGEVGGSSTVTNTHMNFIRLGDT